MRGHHDKTALQVCHVMSENGCITACMHLPGLLHTRPSHTMCMQCVSLELATRRGQVCTHQSSPSLLWSHNVPMAGHPTLDMWLTSHMTITTT